MGDPLTRDAPKRFAHIIDTVCAHDKQYFANHPELDEYIRPMADGEFWPAKFSYGAVRVMKITDGLRFRFPIMTDDPKPYPGRAAQRAFKVFMTALAQSPSVDFQQLREHMRSVE